MTSADGGLTSWPARHPWLALFIAALAAIASILGILHMSADASVQSMFPRGDPAAAAMARVLNEFSAADDLLVLATLPQDQNDTALLSSYAARLSDALHDSPLIEAVVYRTDDQSRRFFEEVVAPAAIYYLSDADFQAARHRLTKPEMVKQIHQNEAMIAAPGPAAGALSAALLQDPLRLHEFLADELNAKKPIKTAGNFDLFLSTDGRSLLIRIIGKKSLGDLDFARQLTDSVQSLTDQLNTDRLQIDISGGYAIAAASQRSIRHDMIVSVVSSIIFLQCLFILAYHRPIRYFLLAFIPVALGILYGMGIRSLISPTISPAAAVVGAVLAGLGIDYTVLYLPHYHLAILQGHRPIPAVAQTTKALGSTLLAACITSVIGFVAVGWSSVPALRDFALVGSLGLFGALLSALWVLPAMLALLGSGEKSSARPRVSLTPLLAWIASRRQWIVASLCLATCACVAVIAFVPGQLFPLESDLTVMHPRPNPPLDAEAKIARKMGTDPGSMAVYLHASSAEDLVRLAYQTQMRLAENSVRQAGLIGTYGLSTLLPDPQIVAQRRNAFTPAEVDTIITNFNQTIADSSFSPAAYQPYTEFLRKILSQPPVPTITDLLPYRRLTDSMLSRDELNGAASTESMTLVFFDRPLDDRAARVAAVDAVRRALADVPGATLTGLGIISLDTEQAIQHDLPRLLLAASALVAVYLLIYFRRLRSALLALVPALFSLIVLFAFLRLTGQKFNLINLVALPLLIGIDVDYGIFLVSLARRRMRNDRSGVPAGISASAHSVMVSAGANVLGFGSLITTSVPAIRSLGWAVGVGVFACFVGTLFLLAPILMTTRQRSLEGMA